nr:MATA-HMG [Rhizophagus irregularis]
MIRISPYISSSWSKEPLEVKEAYKRLSDQAENRLKEIRKTNTLVIIHESLSSPPPPPSPPTNNIIYGPTFFYPYFDYYYYYDYYNDCYYLY